MTNNPNLEKAMTANRKLANRFCPSVEMLENRDMMSVSAVFLSGSTLVVQTDNLATSVSGVRLVTSHAYTVASFTRNSCGVVTSITLRNPWAEDGGGNNDGANDGYVTLTPAQLFGCIGRIYWGKV